MQRIQAIRVVAQFLDRQVTNVSPGALVHQLSSTNVLCFLFAPEGPVGGETEPCLDVRVLPTLAEGTDLYAAPEGFVLAFEVDVEVVHVKPADVAEDLPNAVVAPVLVGISDDVAMGARCSTVVHLFLQVLVRKLVNLGDVAE